MNTMLLVICATSIPWLVLTACLWHRLRKTYMDQQLILGLIKRLANSESEKLTLRTRLSRQYVENDRLTSEKLKSWNIPDHI